MGKKSTTVYLDQSIMDRLKKLSSQGTMTQSELIRKAVEEYLDRRDLIRQHLVKGK